MNEHVESKDEPRQYLLEYLLVLTRAMSERSAGSYGRILNDLNRWIRTESGEPIRSLRVELTPAEREVFRREDVNLARLPDRTNIIRQLKDLYESILQDVDESQGLR